jgi:DNA-binding LytR/AlgR family response regulator
MRIAICEDEKECRDNIFEHIKPYKQKYNQITVTDFSSGTDLLDYYDQGDTFDLIFMDVEMDGINGVETVKEIRKTDKKVMVIFVTSHFNFVCETFRVGAFQFLTKPIKEKEFKKDFERAIERYKINNFKYTVEGKLGTAFFSVDDVHYIESYNRHLYVCGDGNKFEFTGRISEEQKKLSGFNFIRAHQGFLVNMNYIRSFKNTTVMLKNGVEIPVSRIIKNSVIEKFSNFVMESNI